MSRISGGSMLRTRRKDVNVKPNRRLDRKSSRGMIYENEELRLRTININAEVERGQSDIKKLRRENEQLRREIWSLREEYDKLDNLLRNGRSNESDNSQSDSEGDNCDTCSDEDIENQECVENDENTQKTKHKGLRVNFDHLSIVSEENITNSDSANARDEASSSEINTSSKNDSRMELTSESTTADTVVLNGGWDFSVSNKDQKIQSSETLSELEPNTVQNCSTSNDVNNHILQMVNTQPILQTSQGMLNKNVHTRGGPDIFVQNFQNVTPPIQACKTICSFQTKEHLENLFKDLESPSNEVQFETFNNNIARAETSNLTRYRSEINVFLENSQDVGTPPIIPEPMMLLPKLLPYIGFENIIDMPILSSGLKSSQAQTPDVVYPQTSSSILPSSATTTNKAENECNGGFISTPLCDREHSCISAIVDPSEAAQNEQNTEQMKTKTQSPLNRRRTYSPSNKLQIPNERKTVMASNTYAARQRLGSVSSSSDKNEQKTEPTKKSRRVSIYFSGRKKNNSKKSHSKENPGALNDTSEAKRMTKVKATDSCRSTGSKSSKKSKSVHEGSGAHSSVYSTTQESCPEATTSHSERNSVASSRESSTSLSMRSHRSNRKLSAGSMHNGNIPWCGCWGNGCL